MGLYSSIFRAIYRAFRSIHGPGEAHQYPAAALLSICVFLNIGAVFALVRRLFHIELLNGVSLPDALMLCLFIFVLHYLALIRGKSEASFASNAGRGWAGYAAFFYMVGSFLSFFLSV